MRRVQFFGPSPILPLAVVSVCFALAATREGRAEIRIPFDHLGGWWGGAGWNHGFGFGSRALDSTFSRDGRLFAIGANDRHSVEFWDLRDARQVFTLEALGGPADHSSLGEYEFLGDGRTFAAIFYPSGLPAPGHELRLFDVVKREPRAEINFGKYLPMSMNFSPDGATAVVWLPASIVRPKGHPVKVNKKVVAYDMATGQERKRLDTCGQCHSSSSTRSELKKWELQIKLWNMSDGSETLLDRFASNNPQNGGWWYSWASAAFSPDGSMLATPDPSSPASVKFWETKYWQPIRTVSLRGPAERRWPLTRTGRMEFSPDGQWFAAWGHAGPYHSQGEVVIWKVSDFVAKPRSSEESK